MLKKILLSPKNRPNLPATTLSGWKNFYSFSSEEEPTNKPNQWFFQKSKTRPQTSKIRRIYDLSQKMNGLFRIFKKKIDEQNLLRFVQKVQAVTLLGIYETLSFSYLFNYISLLNNNPIYLIGSGGLISIASVYFLQRLESTLEGKRIRKGLSYQSLLVGLSMMMTPAISSISHPIAVPAIFVISAVSLISSLICNQYLLKKKRFLFIGTFAAGVFNSYLALYGASYFSFVAVGNNPFVGAYQNFWVKNEIYLINALFAWGTSGALKAFTRGESDYFKVAFYAFIKFVKKFVSLLIFFLRKIKK